MYSRQPCPRKTGVGPPISLIDGKILTKIGFAALIGLIILANSLFFGRTVGKFPKRPNRELNQSIREANQSNRELNPGRREFN
jgi:hypothetical protein